MRALITGIFTLMTLTLAATIAGGAVPPLTDEQKALVTGARDFTGGIDDAFYALMENAASWDAEEPLTAVPVNVKAVLDSPAEYRGTLLKVTGRYEASHDVTDIQRPGPWGNKIEQWGLRVEGQAGEPDAIVMVYLVRPPPVPVKGRQVEAVGRFFKVFRAKVEDGSTRDFLVFVSRSATVIRGSTVPGLTESQRQRLANAQDFAGAIDDNGAVYPLLENAWSWKGEQLPAAPLITHSDPIVADPAGYRGVLLRVEGVLGGREKVKFALGGPWAGTLEEWKIRITEPNDGRDEWVVVCLVDPPAEAEQGDRVRVSGRFFKIWRIFNMQQQPFNYIVLVGRSAEVLTGAAARTAGDNDWGGSGAVIRVLIGVFAFVVVGFFMLRRYMKRVATGGSAALIEQRRERRLQERGERKTGDEHDESVDDSGPPLPKDPIEALAELERRKETLSND